MKLLEFKASPNCLRVRMAFRAKGVPYTSVEVDPLDRREVERISGQRTVPVLIDGKKILDDSTTILRYLEKKLSKPPLFFREGSAAAQNEILLDWGNEVFRKSVKSMFQQAFKPKEERDQKIIRMVGKTFSFHLRLLEQWLSDGRAYLTGEELAAADCAIFPFVTYAILPEKLKGHALYGLHYDFFHLPEEAPHLRAWIERLQPLSDWELRV